MRKAPIRKHATENDTGRLDGASFAAAPLPHAKTPRTAPSDAERRPVYLSSSPEAITSRCLISTENPSVEQHSSIMALHCNNDSNELDLFERRKCQREFQAVVSSNGDDPAKRLSRPCISTK